MKAITPTEAANKLWLNKNALYRACARGFVSGFEHYPSKSFNTKGEYVFYENVSWIEKYRAADIIKFLSRNNFSKDELIDMIGVSNFRTFKNSRMTDIYGIDSFMKPVIEKMCLRRQ